MTFASASRGDSPCATLVADSSLAPGIDASEVGREALVGLRSLPIPKILRRLRRDARPASSVTKLCSRLSHSSYEHAALREGEFWSRRRYEGAERWKGDGGGDKNNCDKPVDGLGVFGAEESYEAEEDGDRVRHGDVGINVSSLGPSNVYSEGAIDICEFPRQCVVGPSNSPLYSFHSNGAGLLRS